MKIAIIGLPNSGKTTVFNALTRGTAETAVFSSGRLEPNLASVKVPDPRLEVLAGLRGRLRHGCTPLDLLRASFPGGSITGAPKVRAMEIIAQFEPTARGPYCGSLGYIGFDGAMDTSILIRTITAGRGWWQLPVGGGIVAQSSPTEEYEETWQKAAGLIHAFKP